MCWQAQKVFSWIFILHQILLPTLLKVFWVEMHLVTDSLPLPESSSLALVEKPSPNCLPQSPKAFQMSQWWQMRNLCSDIFFLLFMRKVLFPIGPGSMLNGCIVYILYIYFEWHTDSVTVFQFEYEKPGIKRIVVRLQIRHNIVRFLKLYLIPTNLLGEPLVFCLLILGIWTLLNTGCFFSLKVPSTKKLI